MYSATAKLVFEELIRQGILEEAGSINLTFMGVNLPIQGNNAIGDLMQEWLAAWLAVNGFSAREPLDKQEAPDFFLSDKDEEDLLEIKFFTKSPNFDLAYWDAFVREIPNAVHRLDVDYLVFEYEMADGLVRIKRLWLKKLWELAAPSGDLPLKFQRKDGKLVNMRPGTFYSAKAKFSPFANLGGFLDAAEETLNLFRGKAFSSTWRDAIDEGLSRRGITTS